jgi:hypothetical protein
MECLAGGSLRLDAGGLDHLAPFLGFVGDELFAMHRNSYRWGTLNASRAQLHTISERLPDQKAPGVCFCPLK